MITQLHLIELTNEYYNAKTKEKKEEIAEKTKELRKSKEWEKQEDNSHLSVSNELDNIIKNKGYISQKMFCDTMRDYRISFKGFGTANSPYLMHIGLTNEDIVTITDGEDTYYGGDQRWFGGLIEDTGCGSISMMNVLLYNLNMQAGNVRKTMTKQAFMDFYYENTENLIFGIKDSCISTADEYVSDINDLFEDNDIDLFTAKSLSYKKDTQDDAMTKIIETLLHNEPVALQHYLNSSGNVTKWHWVTISGAEINFDDLGESVVHFSSWGKKDETTGTKTGNTSGYKLSDFWRNGASIVYFS